METRVAVLAIIVRGGSSVQPLNELLHQYGQYIIGRMGVPYREKGVNIISVALDAPGNVISALSGKIGRLDGITAKRSTRPRAASERKKNNEKESQTSLGPVPDDCARLLARRLRQKADETPNDARDDQQTEQEEFTPASYSIAALKALRPWAL